jgi:HlyD family secretion protein
MRIKAMLFVAALALAAAAGGWEYLHRVNDRPPYVTAIVDRGDIVQTIAANGTLNPVILVNVGTQISGTVHRIYVDFNDQVKAGQVLAELDPALIQAAIAQRQADLASAEACLRLAPVKERRTRELVAKGFVHQAQLDDAIKETEAAEAQVAAARAQLEREQVNLRYSVIRSPISGIVVARNVDVGQTVAASFQTPTLFQIAKDLKQMQIYAAVAEADVGAIQIGQQVRFTVDAFPEQTFVGIVSQIRLNPTVQQNVVTYNVVVTADNPEGILLPGMTAHVYITLRTRENALRVPNAALRFVPQSEREAPFARSQRPEPPGTRTVYRLEQGKLLVPVQIRTGISDSNYTEVVSGELKAGDTIVLRQARTERTSGTGGPAFRFRL